MKSIGLTLQQAREARGMSIEDVARVISGYSDVLALRTFSQQTIEQFAAVSSCPVVNALSDDRHPCQALTDLLTIREIFGDLAGNFFQDFG